MQKRVRVFRPFEKGDRVVANQQAGFHKGAHGVIEYITPSGEIWVLRDRAGSPVFYHAPELDFENPEDGYCLSDPAFEKSLMAEMTSRRNDSSDPEVFLEGFEAGARWGWGVAQEIMEKQSST
jgi:hypothetical protein